MTESGAIAINCRTNVYFKKGDILGVGYKGLSEENLKRLIKIRRAILLPGKVDRIEKVVGGLETKIQEVETKESEGHTTLSTDDIIDSIMDINELDDYAKDSFSIELDKTKSLKKMKKELKEKLKIPKGDD